METELLEKGELYQARRRLKQNEKVRSELSECTFKPNMRPSFKNEVPEYDPAYNSSKSSQSKKQKKLSKMLEFTPGSLDSPKKRKIAPPKRKSPLNQDLFSDEEVPIIYLDVDIGGNEITRLVMYENDTPEDMVQAFSEAHHLSEERK